MKYIRKNASPQSLEQYKITPGASFDRLPSRVKKDIKDSLLDEQGGICCYCGNRITFETSNIEHFKPKDINLFPRLQLEYSNLLSSCLGGQIERHGDHGYPLSCDARKKNKIIPLSPTDPTCESQFEYDLDGSIKGITADAKKTIDELNLNNTVIKNRRKSAIDAIISLEIETKKEWNVEINRLSQRTSEGNFLPYCFAVIYCIKRYCIPMAAA
ncbi:MAG: TIGR02646 family protein [Alphaproteobacteria bacterium]|nr:TIGR02646 family protein [Alphaproteobacteria bacterium]